MRIVFALPSMGFGGAERVVSVLANEMCKSHDVSIVLTSNSFAPVYPLDKRIVMKEFQSNISNRKRWVGFRKYCVDYKADIVFAFMDTIGIMASISMAFSGIPVIVSERNDPSEKSRKLHGPLALLGKISLFTTSGYVFQSEGARSFYPKIAQRKSTVILNPIDTNGFPNRDGDSDNCVVTIGRLHRQKNHKLLINAFLESKISKETTLHIYGDGELREELQQLIEIKNASDKIVLEGNHKDVLDRIRNARLFVFTSLYEGLPNCLMEAMCIGIPCISTDCTPGGARMLIQDGVNGYLVPNNDKGALVKALDRACVREKMSVMGENGKRLREQVRVDAIARQWIAFSEQYIKRY